MSKSTLLNALTFLRISVCEFHVFFFMELLKRKELSIGCVWWIWLAELCTSRSSSPWILYSFRNHDASCWRRMLRRPAPPTRTHPIITIWNNLYKNFGSNIYNRTDTFLHRTNFFFLNLQKRVRVAGTRALIERNYCNFNPNNTFLI